MDKNKENIISRNQGMTTPSRSDQGHGVVAQDLRAPVMRRRYWKLMEEKMPSSTSSAPLVAAEIFFFIFFLCVPELLKGDW
jgi:hypothetical protein